MVVEEAKSRPRMSSYISSNGAFIAAPPVDIDGIRFFFSFSLFYDFAVGRFLVISCVYSGKIAMGNKLKFEIENQATNFFAS
jgi:hypothetical protein